MTPCRYCILCNIIPSSRYWPVVYTSYWYSRVNITWKGRNGTTYDIPWRRGIFYYRPFRWWGWYGPYHNCYTICRPSRCGTMCAWTPARRTGVAVPDCGSNCSCSVSFQSCWTHSSLSYIKNHWSFCIGTITLLYFCTVGTVTWRNHHREFSLWWWITVSTLRCTCIMDVWHCGWYRNGSIPS